jgi:monoamine oxidase
MTTQNNPSNSDNILDVAIIGGGVAGTYAAYRLISEKSQNDSGKPAKICLFERSDRIGGRLWSYKFPGLTSLHAELGGIGFARIHQNVYNLCKDELGLGMAPCGPFSKQNFYHLRRHTFTDADFADADAFPDKIPFYVTDDEKRALKEGWSAFVGKILGERVEDAEARVEETLALLKKSDCADFHGDTFQKALSAIDEDIKQLRDACIRFEDGTREKISDVGFWNMLEDAMSTEAWQLITYSVFALSFFRNWNSYDSILGFYGIEAIYECSPPFWQLSAGYQSLPLELAKRFQDKGGEIRMQRTLNSVRRRTIDGEQYLVMSIADQEGALREVVARSVILALPRRALELLDPDSVMYESADFESLMDSVQASPAFKAYMSFDEAWWERDDVKPGPIKEGYAVTDLPIRACYYMGKERDGRALLNASLSDEYVTQFWSGYMQSTLHGTAPEPYPGENDADIPDELKAPNRMIVEIRRELEEMHGIKDMAELRNAVYFDWTDDPYGGGWHSWKPRCKSWELMPEIRHPVKDARVYICGEAYSSIQGWVEGAINTTEMVLCNCFKLPPASWIPKNYDCGP